MITLNDRLTDRLRERFSFNLDTLRSRRSFRCLFFSSSLATLVCCTIGLNSTGSIRGMLSQSITYVLDVEAVAVSAVVDVVLFHSTHVV